MYRLRLLLVLSRKLLRYETKRLVRNTGQLKLIRCFQVQHNRRRLSLSPPPSAVDQNKQFDWCFVVYPNVSMKMAPRTRQLPRMFAATCQSKHLRVQTHPASSRNYMLYSLLPLVSVSLNDVMCLCV